LSRGIGLLALSHILSSRVTFSASRGIMSSRVIRDGSTNTITVIPTDGSHSATVIIMHGLGDSADGFSDVAEMFASRMPHVKFVLPTAPSQPVTLNGGMVMNSWCSLDEMI
jgi:hypothetical protein